jgi:hypothetical protein
LVTLFVQDLSARARQYREPARQLVEVLEQYADRLGLDPQAASGRLHTARLAADLLDALDSQQSGIEIIRCLAKAPLGGPPQRAGRSIRSAQEVVRALRAAPWDNFNLIAGLSGEWAAEADAIMGCLRAAAADDELTTPLAPALERARTEAVRLLRKAIPPARERHGEDELVQRVDPDGLVGPKPDGRLAVATEEVDQALSRLKDVAAQHPGKRIEVSWRVVE